MIFALSHHRQEETTLSNRDRKQLLAAEARRKFERVHEERFLHNHLADVWDARLQAVRRDSA